MAKSEQQPPGTDNSEREPLTSAANRGLNPLNWPDYYRQYRHEDPDQPEAKKIRDPDVWDDPDPPLRKRLIPDTGAKKALAVAAGLMLLGLVVYLYPVFAPAYQSTYSLGAFTLLAAFTVVYVKGREDGMDAYRELDKWVTYYGGSIEVRPGEHVGSTGSWELFEVIRNVSYGGFNARKLLKRDLPFAPSLLRTNANDCGDDPAVDALNPTAEVADTEHLGKFIFVHGNDLDYADGMERADRMVTHPRTLDQEAFDEFLRLLNEMEHEVRRLEDDVEMLREHAESVTDTRSEIQTPQLQRTIKMMQELRSIANQSHRQRQDRDDAAPTIGAGVNGNDFDPRSNGDGSS